MLRRIFLRAFVLTVGLLSFAADVAPVAGQGLVWPTRRPTTKIPTTVQSGWKVEVRKPGTQDWTVNSTYSSSDRARAAVTGLYNSGLQVRLTKFESLTLRRARAASVQPKQPFPDAIDWPAAVSVFRKMESLGDRVAFRFPADGCYARRPRLMSQEMKRMGLHPWKVWSKHNGREPLYAKTSNHPRGYVTWGWHVAPVLRVKLSSGKVIWCVFDPSLFARPGSLKEWKKIQTRPGASVSPLLEVTAPGRPPEWNGKRVGPGYTVGDDIPQYRLDQMAQAKMKQYKPYQGKWHPRLDKDAPEWVKSGMPYRTGLMGMRGSPAPQKSATRAALIRQRRAS